MRSIPSFRPLALAFGLGLLALACDSASDKEVSLSPEQKAEVSEDANETVDAALDLKTLQTKPTDENTLNSLTEIFTYASGLWSTKMQASNGGLSTLGLTQDLEALHAALDEDPCITRQADKVIYDCQDVAGLQVVGWVEVQGDTVGVDMDIMGQGYELAYEGVVTVTETSIDGHLDMRFSSTEQGEGFVYDVRIRYDGIQLDEAHCPVGGSLRVDVDVQGTGEDANPYGNLAGAALPSVRVVFGPACGDVRMF